jgi:hypothetical protein
LGKKERMRRRKIAPNNTIMGQGRRWQNLVVQGKCRQRRRRAE